MCVYANFPKEFDESEPRYAVYDFSYNTGEGIRNKICFFAYTPLIDLFAETQMESGYSEHKEEDDLYHVKRRP